MLQCCMKAFILCWYTRSQDFQEFFEQHLLDSVELGPLEQCLTVVKVFESICAESLGQNTGMQYTAVRFVQTSAWSASTQEGL